MSGILTKTARIASLVAGQVGLSSYPRSGQVIYNDDFDLVVRGIYIERSSQKNSVYARNFYGVFLFPNQVCDLSFSKRLPNLATGFRDTLFVGAGEDIASKIAESIACEGALSDFDREAAAAKLIQNLGIANVSRYRNLEHLLIAGTLACYLGDTTTAIEFIDASNILLKNSQKSESFLSDAHKLRASFLSDFIRKFSDLSHDHFVNLAIQITRNNAEVLGIFKR